MNAQTEIAPFDGRNITPFDELTTEIQDLYDEAKNWTDGSPLETQAQCDALDTLDKALLDAGKNLDAIRVDEKRPLDEQIDAIQARFNPFIQPKKGKVDMARAALNPLRAAWKKKLADAAAERAEKARREAEEERRKAEEAMRASAGNLELRERAEEQLVMAKDAERYAARAEKTAATGLGLRTVYRADLTDLNAAVRFYWPLHKDRFAELVTALAQDDVRAGKREIPGFSIVEEKRAL